MTDKQQDPIATTLHEAMREELGEYVEKIGVLERKDDILNEFDRLMG